MGLGYQALMRDIGFDLKVRVWTDSSAALGICTRQGLGKLRHLDTHSLWVQQAVRSGRISVRKVRGDANPADLYTKHIPTRAKIEQLLSLYECFLVGGRAKVAPALRKERLAKEILADVVAVDGSTDWEGLEQEAAALHRELADLPIPPENVLPHMAPDLSSFFPELVVNDHVATDYPDLTDLERDPLAVAGARVAARVISEAETSGRRRKPLASSA